MQFVAPAGMTTAALPQPLDSSVEMTERDAGLYAVKSFPGVEPTWVSLGIDGETRGSEGERDGIVLGRPR